MHIKEALDKLAIFVPMLQITKAQQEIPFFLYGKKNSTIGKIQEQM